MSTSSICSARRTTSSGTVSRWRTPVIRSTTSLSDSRCCTFTVVSTSMPASSSSSTSCQRLALREPGALVWASSSTSADLGLAGQHARRGPARRARWPPTRPPRHDLEAVEQLGGLRPAVRLDEADDDVGAAVEAAAGLAEHREGLAHARAPRRGRCAAHPVVVIRVLAVTVVTPSRCVCARRRFSSVTLTVGSPRKPRIRPVGRLRDQLLHPVDRQPGHPRHPGDLQLRVGRADVRVEARRRRGHRVRRHRAPGRRPRGRRSAPAAG